MAPWMPAPLLDAPTRFLACSPSHRPSSAYPWRREQQPLSVDGMLQPPPSRYLLFSIFAAASGRPQPSIICPSSPWCQQHANGSTIGAAVCASSISSHQVVSLSVLACSSFISLCCPCRDACVISGLFLCMVRKRILGKIDEENMFQFGAL
jgi:hypothetical protein|uniref:Uncharacterized protein n=1 Tax=Zea mays TaxID=4577 RepID=B4FA82_MAIZE|nr:unknown [Zea mays]|eukprot:NP_001130702.1 uncharacterized protein LOC100191805 [Zea mays]